MKKSYTKPQLWAESFQPSDAIAGPCTLDVGFSDTGADGRPTCGYYDKDWEIRFFVDISTGVCETMWDDGEDKGCYHIPVDGSKYFGS